LVRKPILFAAGAAIALAGAAIAAAPKSHVMNIALPDGSIARIEYVGDVAPKVTVAPRRLAGMEAAWAPMPLPSLAGVDRMIEQMNRERAAMIARARLMARQAPAAPGTMPYVASFGNAPAGATSTSVVSVSNGGKTCTRRTEVYSQGAGKPPRVVTNASGDCEAIRLPPSPATPAPPARSSSAPLDHA
jgi:hypothetical protein